MTEVKLLASTKGDPNCMVCQSKIKDSPEGTKWYCSDMTMHVPTLCESCREEAIAIRVSICSDCLSEGAKKLIGWDKEKV